ncbi:hypothetical protein [Deinococcus sp. HSC-46F16]|uniref:hypothetical protein n=1 Tax=Deinococcus sp. HSC-46F16 TaxID=2910968 RepID=UPI00209F08B6
MHPALLHPPQLGEYSAELGFHPRDQRPTFGVQRPLLRPREAPAQQQREAELLGAGAEGRGGFGRG